MVRLSPREARKPGSIAWKRLLLQEVRGENGKEGTSLAAAPRLTGCQLLPLEDARLTFKGPGAGQRGTAWPHVDL